MVAEKKYFQPKTVEEAVKTAHKYEGDCCFIAGGTDVIVNKFHENNSFSCFIDITEINETKKVIRNGKHLKIGSGISLDELKNYGDIVKEFPVILEAAEAIASPIIRKTATIGGNILCENRCVFYNQSSWWRQSVGSCLKCEGDICIATGGKKNCFSKFISDMAIALISMDAYIEVIEYRGGYVTSLESIYTGDGIEPRKLNATSLITSIHIPLNQDFRSVFKKLRQRESLEFTSLTSVVTVNKYEKIKIVLGGVDPRPVVVEGTFNDNKQELIRQAMKKPRIVANDVFSREYRKEMIGVFLNRSFNELQKS
jgi:4-hydroxybenzoyl-CoA reductase subunit beta